MIVAGVLAALAVDQWREGRQELVLERELLESLAMDLVTDSTDFAALPARALGRVTAAEILLRNFHPNAPRAVGAMEAIDTLGPYPAPVSDDELVRAFAGLTVSSDLDVANGAYREFSEGGGQRLVRNVQLRRRIHDYHYLVAVNLKFEPWVASAISEVQRRGYDLGLARGDSDAALIRDRLSSNNADSFFAAVRELQSVSVTQNRIGSIFLLEPALHLLDAIRSELTGRGEAAT